MRPTHSDRSLGPGASSAWRHSKPIQPAYGPRGRTGKTPSSIQRLTEAWNPPCRFYRFGSDAPPAPTPPPTLPLPPWDSTNQQIVQDYYTVATAIQGSSKTRPVWVERLQGEIHVAGRPELVTLYRVDKLIQGGGAFLYIDVQAEQAPDVMHIQQSGIAHGNN